MEFEARDIIFKSGDTMQLMDIMEKMELLESIFIKLIMILILILKPIDLHILQKILMIQLYWVEQMIQQILDQSNNMNDIVTEIKLVGQVIGLLQVHEGRDKGHPGDEFQRPGQKPAEKGADGSKTAYGKRIGDFFD